MLRRGCWLNDILNTGIKWKGRTDGTSKIFDSLARCNPIAISANSEVGKKAVCEHLSLTDSQSNTSCILWTCSAYITWPLKLVKLAQLRYKPTPWAGRQLWELPPTGQGKHSWGLFLWINGMVTDIWQFHGQIYAFFRSLYPIDNFVMERTVWSGSATKACPERTHVFVQEVQNRHERIYSTLN